MQATSFRKFGAFSFLLTFLIVNLASADEITRQGLYKAHVIYRSRTENTTAYLRKIDLLHAATIQNFAPGFLDDRMAEIDQSKQAGASLSKDSLTILGLTAGKFKAVGTAFQVYDYSKKYVLGERKAPAPGIGSSFELNEALNGIFAKAARDLKFAKVVDKYLGAQFGAVNGSEKDLLEAYPPFSDHVSCSDP